MLKEPRVPHAISHDLRPTRTTLVRLLCASTLVALAGFMAVGCEVKSFLDPTQMADPKKRNRLNADGTATPIVQVILDELDLGVASPEGQFPDARDVSAADLLVQTADYVVGPSDLLRVRMDDFPFQGSTFTDVFRVTDTGNINMPDVDEVPVTGMTETEVADAIEQAYVDAGILQPGFARINVIVAEALNRTYTIIGNGVGAPGRYPINKPEFRLLDALAIARGITNPKAASEYAYVIRQDRSADVSEDVPDAGEGDLRPGQEDPLRPEGQGDAGESSLWQDTFASAQGQRQGQPQAQPAEGESDEFAFEAPQEPQDREVIRVPIRDLLNGQQKYNIVVRPDDTIILNADSGGLYYVYGNANVNGTFQIVPGERLTMKRMIAASRGLNAVAVPQRTQLVRQYGDQDVFVRIDLAKIFVGQEPDLYIRPNDMIMIGTNFPAPFLAALRNGFRVTYGFGFLYDRNFAREREGNF